MERIRIAGRGPSAAVAVMAFLVGTAGAIVGSSAPAPAAAAEPTLTVSPSSDIAPGDVVTLTVSGADFEEHRFAVCDRGIVDDWDVVFAVVQYCDSTPGFATPHQVPPGTTAEIPFTIPSATYPTALAPDYFTCGDEPDDCVIVDATWTTAPGTLPEIQAYAVIDMVPPPPPPTLVVEPHVGLSPAQTVSATGAGYADEVVVRQCTSEWVAQPRRNTADDSCGPHTAVIAAADGTIAADVTVTDPLVTVGNRTAPCSPLGCHLVVGNSVVPALASAILQFAEPVVTYAGTTDLPDGSSVSATATGVAGPVTGHLCAADAGPGRCDPDSATAFTERSPLVWSGHVPVGDAAWGDGSPESPAIDCRTQTCVIEVRQGDVVLGEPAPLTFIDMPELALTPSEGLAVGDVITVEGRGLNPSQPYMLFLCGAEGGSIFECTPDLSRLLQSDAAGTLRTTVAAPLTVGQYGFCGNGCKVGLSPMWGGPDATAPFDLIDGAVTATPSTDLVDGQQVQVEGTDLLPTYTGTPRWFETGGWALVQCDSALLDRVDLVAVFTHCGIPAGGGAVDVPGTTSSNAVNVTRDLTTIVGTAVDCGAAPGRCVVGLVRYEQDATVTDHLAPLTFSPG